MTYADDVTPSQCWQQLTENQAAQIVDVRTVAEWSFVGLPDLSTASKDVICEEWQQFPTMQVNEAFAHRVGEKLQAIGTKTDDPLFFLCRSGVRSKSAAAAMTAAGYTQCFNITGGFEGDKDDEGHRGGVNGWKVENLPWRQG
ncbi:MAG: rhodanese-like domain-containing protein [Pseudomonadota bacterium]